MAKSKYESHVLPRFEEIRDWLRNGATDKDVYERLGVSADSFYEYKKKQPEFSELLKNSKDYCDAKVENALYEAALSGNITAQIFWLKNRRPAQWRENPVNKDLPEDVPLRININIADCSEVSDE